MLKMHLQHFVKLPTNNVVANGPFFAASCSVKIELVSCWTKTNIFYNVNKLCILK